MFMSGAYLAAYKSVGACGLIRGKMAKKWRPSRHLVVVVMRVERHRVLIGVTVALNMA